MWQMRIAEQLIREEETVAAQQNTSKRAGKKKKSKKKKGKAEASAALGRAAEPMIVKEVQCM